MELPYIDARGLTSLYGQGKKENRHPGGGSPQRSLGRNPVLFLPFSMPDRVRHDETYCLHTDTNLTSLIKYGENDVYSF